MRKILTEGAYVKVDTDLLEVYRRLLEHYGPQGWWPAETQLEIAVGAILVQRTKWRNAARALERLKAENLLESRALASTPTGRLRSLLRGTGLEEEKAERLSRLARLLVNYFDGSLEKLLRQHLEEARRSLLSVKGVGPETADVILLYAGGKPIFPIDQYTRRLSARLGLRARGYRGLQRLYMEELPRDLTVYKEMHALIDRLGREHCRAQPRCGGCPLIDLCRYSGATRRVRREPFHRHLWELERRRAVGA